MLKNRILKTKCKIQNSPKITMNFENFEKIYLEILFKKNIDRSLLDQIFINFKTNPEYFAKYHKQEPNAEPDESNRFCLHCSLLGHIVEKCPYKRLRGDELYEYISRLDAEIAFDSDIRNEHKIRGTKCYRCKKLGHIARHCRENIKKKKVIIEKSYVPDNYSECSDNSVPYDFDPYDD